MYHNYLLWAPFIFTQAFPSTFKTLCCIVRHNTGAQSLTTVYSTIVMLYFSVIMVFSSPVWVIQIWRLIDSCFWLCHHCFVSHILSCILLLSLMYLTPNNNNYGLHCSILYDCTLYYMTDLISSQISSINMSTLTSTINQSTIIERPVIIVSSSTKSMCTLIWYHVGNIPHSYGSICLCIYS